MEKRQLRSRNCKGVEKENVQPQPARRIRRAISTVEGCLMMKAVKPMKLANASSQTDNCLAATNAQLTQELIGQNNLLKEKDKKYINMLERYFLDKEKLTAENREKNIEIARLKNDIEQLQSQPLVEVAINGEPKVKK